MRNDGMVPGFAVKGLHTGDFDVLVRSCLEQHDIAFLGEAEQHIHFRQQQNLTAKAPRTPND